jgi:hypothetical protein
MGLNEFFGQAHGQKRPDGRPLPISGPAGGPVSSIEVLLTSAKVGIDQYGPAAYAILLHPMDYFKMELKYMERQGIEKTLKALGNCIEFHGCICQQAAFINEGTYVVIDERDYWELEKMQEDHQA